MNHFDAQAPWGAARDQGQPAATPRVRRELMSQPNGYWLWGGEDELVQPTDHIVFYINGRFVSELTMLKDNAGSYIRLAPIKLPAGEYEFSFASMTDEAFHQGVL